MKNQGQVTDIDEARVEGYHAVGMRILEEGKKEPITKLLQRVAVSLKRSERTLWYAVQFAEKYPDFLHALKSPVRGTG